jgi:type III secretion protein J
MPVSLKNSAYLHILMRVLLLCIAVPFFSSCGSQKTIVNGLDEKEANEIIVYLSGKNIDAVKTPTIEAGAGASKQSLWDIKVNSEQSTEAMSLLNQVGLPRRRGQNLLNIFSAGGLVPSEMQERIRYQAGLAEQIASTIRKIDGVLDAEVQISFPEDEPLNPTGEKKQKITASVYVKHSGVLDDPNSHLITKIKRLVAASITGLDYDNVTVIGDLSRYSGLPMAGDLQTLRSDVEKQLVSVWTIVLAKDSILRFRIIFFSFMIAILLLLLSLIWLAWKTYPLLREHGGLKELFHIHPISEKKKSETADTLKEVEEKKDESDAKKAEDKIDQGVDET